ncbi:MAG: DUF2933 domain-containing protein [Robiginitomaculum sp.]|nr:DUF2933 domain-containing protein [Robiginitomaculum sp.]
MDHSKKHKNVTCKKRQWFKTPFGILALFILTALGFVLYSEYGSIIGFSWIWLVFLLCSLLHISMHGGHGDKH